MDNESVTLANGYFQLVHDGTNISSLRLDATGEGVYGEDVVAAGGAIIGAGVPELSGPTLRFANQSTIRWAFPFQREGYFDASTGLCYPGTTTVDAVPCRMPIRRFVTSNGQTVFMEYFKRLPVGPHDMWLNLSHGNRFYVAGDDGVCACIDVHCPGQTVARTQVANDHLTLYWDATTAPVTLTVHGAAGPPAYGIVRPAMRFTPDFAVTCRETGAAAKASSLATDLLRMAMYWHPETICGGEWVLDGVRTFRFVDPRSTYDDFLRSKLLANFASLGYDRFEHFGMVFNWGACPDYGAGGLLNVPANNAAYDLRFLHVNAMLIIATAEYILATGDITILDARSERYVATDGAEAQPICGQDVDTAHHILAAGDRRLDGRMPKKIFSLGQSFHASAPFSQVTLRLGSGQMVPGGPTEVTARIWLTRLSDGRIVADVDRALTPGLAIQNVTVQLADEAMPGDYEVRVSDRRSGKDYFGPGITWWTKAEGDYDGGRASFGPFAGSIHDTLKVAFDYLFENTGAKDTNLSQYVDDREFNAGDHKSGRAGVSMQNSYHECLGGGQDAMMGLWYPAACGAMADLAELRGDEGAERRYRDLQHRAVAAYNNTFWHTVVENGRTFARYLGARDWDGNTHDYGFAYYNLEAADFGIASQDQARDILWWLDAGYWKPTYEGPWKEDIYGLWQIAPPFNTVEIGDWINLTGKLPYGELLANGGTRIVYEARDLTVRARLVFNSPESYAASRW